MQHSKPLSLTEPIKRFLIQCVAKAGSDSQPLPNELQLCKRFSVSRPTAHKAVEDLLEIGYICHLPGRRGIFSNPLYATAVPRSVGIISTCGSCTYLNTYNTMALGAFLQQVSDYQCMTTFLTLNSTPEHADEELLLAGLDALFWICPEKAYLPAIQRLLDHDFPLVVLASVNDASAPLPPFNTLTADYAEIGRQRAAFFHKHDCHQVVYCGGGGKTFEAFKHDFPEFDDCLHLPDTHSLENLPQLLQQSDIDGMVCDGANHQHHRALSILSSVPSPQRIKVLLSVGLNLQELQAFYPRLDLHSLCPTFPLSMLSAMGSDAASHLGDMLMYNRNLHFKNQLYHW